MVEGECEKQENENSSPGESEEQIQQQSVENITSDAAPWFIQVASIVYRNKHLRLMFYCRLCFYLIFCVSMSWSMSPLLGAAVCFFALMIEKDYLDRAAIKFEMTQIEQRTMIVWQLMKSIGGHVNGHEERLDDLAKRVTSIPCEVADFTIVPSKKGN